MARLLYLANGAHRLALARIDEAFRGWGLSVEQYWAFGGEFPASLDGYDAVFLSGSPHGSYDDVDFIHREHDLIVAAEARGLPMMGVCFGSQILASALCGRDQVFRRDDCEIGYKDLALHSPAEDDPVMRTVAGDGLRMFVWHNDEVRSDHSDMVVLASSDVCPNQIWRYRNRPVWGIQGHPEITARIAPEWFEQNRERMERDGADIAALKREATDTEQARFLLKAFADFVCDRDAAPLPPSAT